MGVAGAVDAAVVDRGCVPVVGVGGAEVVPDLMGDDVEIPVAGVAVLQRIGERAAQISRHPVAPLPAAHRAEVGDPAVGRIHAGQQVDEFAVDVRHRLAPVHTHLVQRVGREFAGRVAQRRVRVDVLAERPQIRHDQARVHLAFIDLAHRGDEENRVLRRGVSVPAESFVRPLEIGIDRDAHLPARPRRPAGTAGAAGAGRRVGVVHKVDPERVERVHISGVDAAARRDSVDAEFREVGDPHRVRLSQPAARDRIRRHARSDKAVGRVGTDAEHHP